MSEMNLRLSERARLVVLVAAVLLILGLVNKQIVDKEKLIADLRAAENVLREQAIRFFAAWVATI